MKMRKNKMLGGGGVDSVELSIQKQVDIQKKINTITHKKIKALRLNEQSFRIKRSRLKKNHENNNACVESGFCNKLNNIGINNLKQTNVKTIIENSMSRQKFLFVFSLILTMLSALMLILGLTNSQLFSQKTATGTIAFDVSGVTPLTIDNELALYYNESGLTFGSSTSTGQSIQNITPLKIGVNSSAEYDTYYFQVIYEFDNELANYLSFGDSTYTFGSSNQYQMSALLRDSVDANKFVSTSLTAVAKGEQIDVLQYLKNLIVNLDNVVVEETNFSLTLVVDRTNDFSSIFKNQITYNGKIGVSLYEEPSITLDSNFNKIGIFVGLSDVAIYDKTTSKFADNVSSNDEIAINELSSSIMTFTGNETTWKIEIVVDDKINNSVNNVPSGIQYSGDYDTTTYKDTTYTTTTNSSAGTVTFVIEFKAGGDRAQVDMVTILNDFLLINSGWRGASVVVGNYARNIPIKISYLGYNDLEQVVDLNVQWDILTGAVDNYYNGPFYPPQ